MCQMHPNSDVQLWNLFLTINSDFTHQKWMKFAFIVTGSIFLQSYWVLDNVKRNDHMLKKKLGVIYEVLANQLSESSQTWVDEGPIDS